MNARVRLLAVVVLLTAFSAIPVRLMAQALPDSVMVVHYIDVGQANAALLEFSCGAAMIDAGGQDTSDTRHLVEYLRAFFARRTDLHDSIRTILITHNHVDHTRGLRSVIEAFHVGNVIENGQRGGQNDQGDRSLVWLMGQISANQSQVRRVDVDDADVSNTDFGLSNAEIDPVACAGTDPTITVLSADMPANPGWSATEFGNKNNHSVVIRVDFGRSSFLFTGDLQEPAIETMVDFYAGTPMLDSDVWLVGHHGSANATTASLLRAINRPAIAVISMGSCLRNVGQFNAFQFGHPRATIVQMLITAITRQRSQSKLVPVADGVTNFRRITMRDAIYATGWDGTVTIRATATGRYTVNIERQAAGPVC